MMKIIKFLCAVTLIISGCSFSKDDSQNLSTDAVQKKIEKVETSTVKPEGRFQIYHQLELEEANAILSGKSEADLVVTNSNKDFRAYESDIQSISDLILANKETDAVIKAVSLNLACGDLELSLIHNYIRKSSSDFSLIQNFLQKRSCGSVTNEDLYKAFILAARQAFNSKFSDVSLLSYITHHSNFVGAPLVPIGNTGVSINLIALKRVWFFCHYMDVDESITSGKPNDIQNVFACNPPDVTDEQTAGEVKLKKQLGIKDDAIEVRYIKDGKLIIQSGYLSMTLTYSNGISGALVSYFKSGDLGESDEDFGEGVLREMRMEYNQ